MDEYLVRCSPCGLEMTIKGTFTQSLEVYCNRCRKRIFYLPEKSATPEQQSASGEFTMSGSKESAGACPDRSRGSETSAVPPTEEKYCIDDYQLLKKIGEGAIGQVFLAIHRSTGEKIVFKFLMSDSLRESEREHLTEHFIREAQVLSALEHPYIAKFKGVGNFKGKPYLKMEYVEGQDLCTELKEKRTPIPLQRTLTIAFHVAAALEYAREQKLVHRDIKPANIITLASDPTIPKIIDFGLAKMLGDHHQALTQTGTIKGTPYYMPSEQVRDAKHVDHRCDIYALGATLYHMLSGKPPFYEYARESVAVILEKIEKARSTPLSELGLDLPPGVYSLVGKAMEPNPDRRYQTAGEFRQALKDLAKKLPR